MGAPMAFRAIFLGLFAALVVALPRRIWLQIPSDVLLNPWIYCLLGTIAMVFQRIKDLRCEKSNDPFVSSGRSLSELVLHVHFPRDSVSPWVWIRRGTLSLLLSIFGGRAGPEGAASEFSHALAIVTRPRSAHWLETQRRTDAGTVLAAGVAAAFATPLAAIFLPVEIGIGGSITPSVLAALSATVGVHLLGVAPQYLWPTLDLWTEWRDGLGLFAVTIASTLVGYLSISFLSYARVSFDSTFKSQLWLKGLVAGILLVVVSSAFPAANLPAQELIQKLLSEPFSPLEAGLMGLSIFLGLSVVIAGFGTTGVIWPIFTLGCLVGYAMEPLFPGFPRTTMVAGGAALIGTILGTPITGALLAFEMTGQWTVILPCFVAAFAATRLRAWLNTDTLINEELSGLKLDLKDGRSQSVLKSIRVRDAMVTDHECVLDHEMISDVRSALSKSPYPFVVVVNNRGGYVGLLSEDEVSSASAREPIQDRMNYKPLGPILKRFVEAKDLIYRAGRKVPSVKLDDTLDSLGSVFQYTPVVAVTDERQKVVGFLFVHEVRIAYDRELARKHFLHQKADPIPADSPQIPG